MPHLARRPIAFVAILALAGCAGAAPRPHAAAHAPATATAAAAPIRTGPARTCAGAVSATLLAVARRIYGQAQHGSNVLSARRRLAGSPALAAAVASGDPAATRAALRPLLKHQIHRITITRGSRVLAVVRGGPALAPSRGVLRGASGRPVGRYALAVADDGAVTGVMRTLTGAHVTLSAGQRVLYHSGGAAGAGSRTVAFAATAFPRGRLRVALAVPPAALTTCGATPRATVVDTVGAIGERLAQAEAGGSAVHRVLRHVALDPGFRTAVATRDPVALRAAIIRFFRTSSLHVVRVRATDPGGRLIGDVGGPYVLSPASATVRDAGGKVLGSVTLSIQDDTGYVKLMRRFTGVGVVLRTPAGTVPGSIAVAGPSDPYTFTARAFPDGPLSVTLLVPRA